MHRSNANSQLCRDDPMMKKLILAVVLALMVHAMAHAVTLIDCKNKDSENSITYIWPSPYLSHSGLLCFDVKGWLEFSGSNCVANGKNIRWTGLVIVSEDDQSQGRDSTDFLVSKPIVNEDNIEYIIQWSRGGAWRPMQRVAINRLTGVAVSYFVREHGGETYQCRTGKKVF
jgi:hypothetical protein